MRKNKNPGDRKKIQSFLSIAHAQFDETKHEKPEHINEREETKTLTVTYFANSVLHTTNSNTQCYTKDRNDDELTKLVKLIVDSCLLIVCKDRNEECHSEDESNTHTVN